MIPASRPPRADAPARLRSIETEPLSWRDGAPYSARYGDRYASRAGALAQAREVFLGGCGLPGRWQGRPQFVVLEVGFGLGTNFLATWEAWRDDPARCAVLHYVAVERHPLAAADLVAAAPAALQPLAAALAAQWPLPLPGLHSLIFDAGSRGAGRVELILALGDAAHLLPRLVLGADAFYLDGFAPARNPDCWQPALLKSLARLARADAVAASWCVAGSVRAALAQAGFAVERPAGFGGKRERLVARFAPRWTVRRHAPPAPCSMPRAALVAGAGVAGCCAAAALAARGWTVQLLDAGPVAGAASALPAGLLHPQLSSDDNLLSRLTRAGLLHARRLTAQVPAGVRPLGVLQMAASDEDAAAMQRALAALRPPAGYVQWLDAGAAAARLGLAPRRGGLWFADGAIVDGAAWCAALLAAQADRIHLRRHARVEAIAWHDGQWRARGPWGEAAAPLLVVATALDAARLLDLPGARLRAVRGRLSLLAPQPLAGLRAALAGDGYLAPAAAGGAAVLGATYEMALPGEDAPAEADPARAHEGNLARLQRLLAAPPPVQVTGVFSGLRCVAHDRLPLAGPVPDVAAAADRASELRGAHLPDLPRAPGLYCLTALGSRGLTLAPLLAELIAAQAEGAPWPVERDLAAAVDPARFLLQRLRRGRGAAG